MSGNIFGTFFRAATFGESHGPVIGVVIDGCPAGVTVDLAAIQVQLDRRRPGWFGQGNIAATSRAESDTCEILSGVFQGRTTGTSLAILIRNADQRFGDYDALKDTFRPGHGDYTYWAKYGIRDHRGGGRSSGRETAARVAAGAVALAMLRVSLGSAYAAVAWTQRAAGISCETIDLDAIDSNPLRAADPTAAERMLKKITRLRAAGDSAGGILECRVRGIPAGLGEPVFDKLDAEIAKAMLSLGAVKGIEFGAGFACADMTGSEMNDPFEPGENNTVRLVTNNAGGILGGISAGGDIRFRLAVKPVPSIAREQRTVRLAGSGIPAVESAVIRVGGRHDACICPRMVPVVEAMTHLVMADMYLRTQGAHRA
ncbi:MAG: chorismate synthase [Spirochaetaceae bacterium]|jgi:chorismate synthase|nr:chorismate synthase [Spirochaetaceae bacterium]